MTPVLGRVEVYERENKKKAADALAKEARKPATTKSR